MNTYRVTIKVESLNITETITVNAADEGKACSEAMLAYRKSGGTRLRGALATYDVVEVA